MQKFRYLLLVLIISSFIPTFAQAQKGLGDAQKLNINLEDIWLRYKYYPHLTRGFNSMADGATYTLLNQGNIDLYSYKNGKRIKTLVDATAFIPKGSKKALKFSSYTFSNDERKILIPTEVRSIYRHSFSADYWVYDTESKKLSPLSGNGQQRLATFSPDGDKVAFMRDNNLFIVDLVSGNEKQITSDGIVNQVINGAPDWVYEEEFSFTQGFEWSPDGQKIGFLRFDESKVKEFTLQEFGDLYPKNIKYKYPKAGEDNSVVEVKIYSLAEEKTTSVDVGTNTDIYIPRISWIDANQLSFQRLNRLQNHLEIFVSDLNGQSRVVYSEENKYYIDITDNLIWLDKGKGFLISSEQTGFNHLYWYSMQGEKLKQLTQGNFDVMEVMGYDQKKKDLYYIAAKSSPMNRDIFKVNIKSGKITVISSKEGTHSPEFSANFQYYVDNFSTLNTPPYISVNKADGTELYVLEDNADFIKNMYAAGYNNAEFITIKNKVNMDMNAWIIKPKNFDAKKRYPVLMYVYGGPGSQTVNNAWGWFNWMWFQMLAQRGYIVVSVDGRGTGARGEAYKKSTYLKLGKQETEDQIAANEYLASLPYVDGKRIGIFGWSYGGYMSTLCMTKGANYFKAGIAVAPVTNWRYYDNIYTERFMRTPQENGDNYDINSPISHVDKLKGKFLLVHGVADDNVHIQNSMDLITELVDHNKQFDMQFYPNNDHGIMNGRYTRYHLFTKMTDFIMLNL